MTAEQIIILVESIVIVLLGVALLAILLKDKRVSKTKSGNVFIKNGERYTYDKNELTETGDVKITHRTEDIVLERGVTYKVQKESNLIPGKYTVLSAQEATDKFNLRVGGFVREYTHASDIVLKEGETICAVSHSVILR